MKGLGKCNYTNKTKRTIAFSKCDTPSESDESHSSRDCGRDKLQNIRYVVFLSYAQELVASTGMTFVPAPPDPRADAISGTFKIQFAKDLSFAIYKLYVFGATDPNNRITAAHLHAGAANVNGPVVVTLYNNTVGTTSNGLLTRGEIRNQDIALVEGYNTVASLYQGILRGDIYVNVHSQLFPGGVARAQLLANFY